MSSTNKDNAPEESLYPKVLAEKRVKPKVQSKIQNNMLLTKLMKATDCERSNAPEESLYPKVLAEKRVKPKVQSKIQNNMLLTKLMKATDCERSYASYVPNVVAWNCDPMIPVSYYWNNEESSHYLDKAALAEDGNTSMKYRSFQR